MLPGIFKKYEKDISETFKLSLPIMFGRLGAVLMGVADSIMVGKIDYTALASAGIANSIFILVGIIPIGMMIVGSPMISAANSRGDKEASLNIVKSCIQVSMLISVFFVLVLGVFVFNFQWFNQPPEVAALATPYLLIVSGSLIPLMFFIAVEQFTDGLEHTKISMFFNTTGLLVNVFFNWLFIYGNWGMPALGLIGAGIGTFLARTYMAVGIWIVMKNYIVFKDYNFNLKFLQIHKESFYKVLKQGIPSGMQFFFEVSAFSLAAIIIGWLGTVQLAAHNVAISLASITYMISSALATGGSIRVGTAYGTKDRVGVLNAGKSAILLVTILMATSCIVFMLFNITLVKLYNDEPAVIEVASKLIIIAALFQMSDGIQVAAVRALLGIEDIKVPTIITLFSYWILGLPLGCLLTFVFGFDVYGIWIGLLIGLSAAAVLLTYRFFDKAGRIQ